MSFLTFLRDLFIGDSGPSSLPPTNVSVPMPPVKPPAEPSCFARGIAKSLIEEPDQWEIMPYGGSIWGSEMVVAIRHSLTKVRIEATRLYVEYDGEQIVYLPGCKLITSLCVGGGSFCCKVDEILIAQTIEAHPLGQLKRRLEAKRTEDERQAKAKDHFARLGCPETSATTPTQSPQP